MICSKALHKRTSEFLLQAEEVLIYVNLTSHYTFLYSTH